MQAVNDVGLVYGVQSQSDLRVICGPRYNTFTPDTDRREEPAKFFQHGSKRRLILVDEEADRWDGLE